MPEYISLEGHIFGLLTVKARHGKTADGKYQWLCVCQCSKEVVVRGANLRSGDVKSCGCLLCPDLTGKVFGLLTVISRGANTADWKSQWVCGCMCGRVVLVRGGDLAAKKSQSCGCSAGRPFNLTGKTFGRLRVIGLAPKIGAARGLRWLCKCVCGGERVVSGATLRSGITISCGCARGIVAVRSPAVRAKAAVQANRRRSAGKAHFTAAGIDSLYERQKGRCAEPTCKAVLGRVFHRDHIKAVVLGGSNGIQNIQLLCPSCNWKKSSKAPEVWARQMGRLL